MRGFNKIYLLGNVANNLNPVSFPNGKRVVRFDLVVDETYKDKSGNVKDISTWVPCVGMSGLADALSEYVKKGDRLFIEGKYTTAEDFDGNEVHNIMIISYQNITCNKLYKPEFSDDNQTEEDDYGNA